MTVAVECGGTSTSARGGADGGNEIIEVTVEEPNAGRASIALGIGDQAQVGSRDELPRDMRETTRSYHYNSKAGSSLHLPRTVYSRREASTGSERLG